MIGIEWCLGTTTHYWYFAKRWEKKTRQGFAVTFNPIRSVDATK